MKRPAVLLSVLCLAVGGLQAAAQDKYPSRYVKIIVPYAPGGTTDIVARVLAEELHQSLGGSFIVENKPGAYGIIAVEAMARSRPDGYTLMLGNVSTNAITPVLYAKKFSIDYEKDVVPVARLVDIPAFLVATTKDFPPTTVAEFVAYAKQNRGVVTYGSVGVGSYPHYDMALLANRAGIEMIHIPNKAGASGVFNDMLRGDVQVSFVNVASSAPFVKAGQLRALALVNDRRLSEFPDVPPMAEVGYAGVGTSAWQAIFAPAGTPKDILSKLHGAVLQAMKTPAVQTAFLRQNFRLIPSQSLDEAKTWLSGEIDAWRKITAEIKIEVME